MTQKYKKNNSPTIQNSIFSSFPDVLQPNLSYFPDVLQHDFPCFPDVSQPNLSGFPDVSQPDLSDFPDVLQPDLSSFPDVFWFRYGGQHVWRFKKIWATSVVRSPIRVMWKTLVVFGDRD